MPGKRNRYYTYDPAGNITHIQDDAQQTIYFRNKRVEPSNDYTYDALYRLIQASGREHLGQTNGAPNPPTSPDAFNAFHTRRDHPGNGQAMSTYIERYVYDAVGNFLPMQHRGSDPVHAGWTRAYDYLEASLIEDGSGGAPLKTSNRLTGTTVNPNGANPPQVEPYQHDAHGNMVRMPHLGGGLPGPNMHWDYKDQLRQVDRGNGSTAYFVYDASGQRVRKVWEKSAGLTEERVYLGGFEIFRKHGGSIGANTATLERETLHLMDDQQRIALVETRTLDTAGDDQAPRQLIRYQFGNHLGSASLELDEQAQIISYEEYAPYGNSTYQAVRSQTETAKRYRYTGKERDEESGLYYHGARYYAPWFGKWTSADPSGLADGPNLYAYARNSPVVFADYSGTQSSTPTPLDEHDVIYGIITNPRPGDTANWWATGPRSNPGGWSGELSQWERSYVDTFRSGAVDPALRMRQPVDPQNLTSEESAAAQRLFGSGAGAARQYANYETRRRIIAHYVYTHPATVRLELGIYRLFRDANPIHFAFERGWQVGSGSEMFTGEQVSRLGAAAEFFTALAIGYALTRPQGGSPAHRYARNWSNLGRLAGRRPPRGSASKVFCH